MKTTLDGGDGVVGRTDDTAEVTADGLTVGRAIQGQVITIIGLKYIRYLSFREIPELFIKERV